MLKKNNKIRLLSIILSFIMMCFYFGCTTTSHHKLYEGPQLPPDKVALLIGKQRPILLLSVDGLKETEGKTWDKSYKIELLPGNHIIVVDYLLNTSRNVSGMGYVYQEFYIYNSPVDEEISFKAEPGHTYRLTYNHDLNQLKWYAVIIDIASNEKVVESKQSSLQEIRTGDNKF